MKTLAVGCDASGKTTFLESVIDAYNDNFGESSRSEEAQAFKLANLSQEINTDYINKRESLYLNLSHKALSDMHIDFNRDVVTTDSSLITRVSHNTMRNIIGEKCLSDDEIIREWKNDEKDLDVPPIDIVVLLYAPFPVIRERIRQRQLDGNIAEKFWGFNSPFFLEAYQEHWKLIVQELSRTAITCLSIDTDKISIKESLEMYSQLRQQKTESNL